MRKDAKGTGQTLQVLIVEDSEDDTLLLLRELRTNGYNPTFERVETAEAMREALGKRSWDIVILDHVLPKFSSFAALDMLRETGLDLPFIVVSGNIGEDIAVEAMKAGAHDYIMKGTLKRLVPAVERELREAASRRERRWAQEDLDRARELLERVFSVTHVIVAYMDREFNFIRVNPAFAEAYGRTPDFSPGRTTSPSARTGGASPFSGAWWRQGNRRSPTRSPSIRRDIRGRVRRRTLTAVSSPSWRPTAGSRVLSSSFST